MTYTGNRSNSNNFSIFLFVFFHSESFHFVVFFFIQLIIIISLNSMNFLETLRSFFYFCGPIKLMCNFYRDINSHNFQNERFWILRMQIKIRKSQATLIHFSLNMLYVLKKPLNYKKKKCLFPTFSQKYIILNSLKTVSI